MADITLAQLTTGGSSPTGTGVFDVLMQAFKAHLDQEFQKNRIRGPEYAQVYLGGLQAVLDRSLQFLLTEQEAGLKAQLLNEQIKSEVKNNELNGVIDKQIAVLVAEECKLRGEYDVLLEQKTKVIAETALLNQKKATEIGQTQATGVAADSVIGKQKALYQAQTDGYLHNARQKAAKILVDAWSVARTTDANSTLRNTTNNLEDSNVGQAIKEMLAAIGVDPATI